MTRISGILRRNPLAIGTVVLLAVPAVTVPAQQVRPSFSGHWLLDREASTVAAGGRGDATGAASGGGRSAGGGIGLGPPAAELTIRQTDSALHMLVMREDGSGVALLYRLDGKATSNTLIVGRDLSVEASYSTRWDASVLRTTISRTSPGRGTNARPTYREMLYLRADSILVVETSIAGRSDGRQAIYRRARESSPGRSARLVMPEDSPE